MKSGMSLESLLVEVQRQETTKRDFVSSTKEAMRMVEPTTFDQNQTVKIVLLSGEESQLERFEVTEQCHRQIASRLNIPFKYYSRLLDDHSDLVISQVNALFEREPEIRLLRTIDGKARAFLSDRYRRLDNAQVLQQALPPIVKSEMETQLLSTNVEENSMHLKVLFTDPALTQTIGISPDGTPDNVQPYAVLRNSETGQGSLSLKAGFYRSFCLNGCVFGTEEAFSFSRNHIGGKLTEGQDFEIFSDSTQRKQDELIISEVTDALRTISDIRRVTIMGDRLRQIKSGDKVSDAFAAVDTLAREIGIRENEKETVLESFIKDQDYSQWGMMNAVTQLANSESTSYERAQEIELLGSKIIKLNPSQWSRVAEAVPIAA